jgi:ankyrin repeat protein
LKLKYDNLLSCFAFKFDLRHDTEEGRTGVVRMLLERAPGTAADNANTLGATAGIAAAVFHHAEILRVLAEHGANLNVVVGRCRLTVLVSNSVLKAPMVSALESNT